MIEICRPLWGRMIGTALRLGIGGGRRKIILKTGTLELGIAAMHVKFFAPPSLL